jgi:hypothetical protein
MTRQLHIAHIRHKNCCSHFNGNFGNIHPILQAAKSTSEMMPVLPIMMNWKLMFVTSTNASMFKNRDTSVE